MPGHVLLEEFHLTLTAPSATSDVKREAMRRILNSRTLRSALRTAARDVVRRYPQLRLIRLTLGS